MRCAATLAAFRGEGCCAGLRGQRAAEASAGDTRSLSEGNFIYDLAAGGDGRVQAGSGKGPGGVSTTQTSCSQLVTAGGHGDGNVNPGGAWVA